MNLPKIIQGGMGVAISDWKLAQAVAASGQMGVVSGTGIPLIMVGRLMDGDPGGHVQRALAHFPAQDVAQKILETYYLPAGRAPGQPYKRLPMWFATPDIWLEQVTAAACFAEVWLAKEGHDQPVGINLLEKVQMPTMASLYGAMLAEVDVVIMGAGTPFQVPGILDKLAEHQPTNYRLDVHGATAEDDIRIHFDPEHTFPGLPARLGPIKRPLFFPIVSSVVLAKAFTKRASGRIDGFVIELPVAGGHNAPPREPGRFNDKGEPLYGEKDEVDPRRIAELGYPFYLAGGYDTPEKFRLALEAGATGVQIGTAFAFCTDSGMDPDVRQRVLNMVIAGTAEVRTDPVASPTGFPFKVVQMEGTISEPQVYEERPRKCDIGYLRHIVKNDEGKLIYRCPAEPVDDYLKKGGTLEETECRACLCNNLFATAGQPQIRRSGYVEQPIVTSGDELVHVDKFLKPGQVSYTAADVIAFVLAEVEVLDRAL